MNDMYMAYDAICAAFCHCYSAWNNEKGEPADRIYNALWASCTDGKTFFFFFFEDCQTIHSKTRKIVKLCRFGLLNFCYLRDHLKQTRNFTGREAISREEKQFHGRKRGNYWHRAKTSVLAFPEDFVFSEWVLFFVFCFFVVVCRFFPWKSDI